MDKNKIPHNLKEKLAREQPKEKLLIALRSDIIKEAKYGEEWLFVTEKNVLVYSAGGRKLHGIAVKNIRKAEAADLVGSGVIELTVGSSVHRVIMFSNAKTPDFYQAADDIGELAKGRKISSKESQTKKVICETCKEPIPEYMNKCPRCTDKTKTIMRIMFFVKPYMGTILLILLFLALGSLCGLVAPYLLRLFVDYVFYTGPIKGSFPYAELFPWMGNGAPSALFPYSGWFLWVTLVLFLSNVGQLFFQGLQERFSGALGYKTVYDVRSAIYEKLQELS
ncbi:MAG: hypothetical protein WCI43_08305, partial [Candidatus Firestonebacteria bacterium]